MPSGVYIKTEQHKSKIRQSCIGINKGIKRSGEYKEKMRLLKLGKPSKRKGIKTGFVPKSAFKIGQYTEAQKRGSILGAKTLSQRKITSIEKILYSLLEKTGLFFERQKIINGKFLVDAYVPKLKLVIEVDGNYWHSLDRIVKKDKAENAYLTKCGYRILRISEHDITKYTTASLYSEIIAEKRGVLN